MLKEFITSIITDSSKRRVLVYTVQITTILFLLSMVVYFIVSGITRKHSYIVRNYVEYVSGGAADVSLSNGLRIWLPGGRAETEAGAEGDLIILKDEHLQEVARMDIRRSASSLPYGSIAMHDEAKLSRAKMEYLLEQFIDEQGEMTWPGKTMEWRHFGYSYIRDTPVLYGLGILRLAGGDDENSTIYKCVRFLDRQAEYLISAVFPASLRVWVEPELNNIIGSIVLPGS